MQISDILSENHLSECRKKAFALISLAIIILSVYSNTFDSSWHFDDEQNILTRQAIHLEQLSWSQIKKTFIDNEKIFRPVACLSLALNYFFGKEAVFGYHIINIFIHFITSIFLFHFIYHTLNLPKIKRKYGKNAYFISLLASIFWAINPVQTQAITYIVQRMASMAAMFYIMSMFFYLKARIAKKRLKQVAYYLVCFIFGVLAFGSKENATMLPISILLFDLLLIQGFTRVNLKKNLLIFFVLFSFLIISSLITHGSSILFDPGFYTEGYIHRNFTLSQRLLTELRIVLFYISLLFYPMPNRLCITHEITLSQGLLSPPSTLISMLIIMGLIIYALIKVKKWPLLSYCILFFFINHLIESTILPLELAFEHRNYLPSLLFFVPISILILKIIQNYAKKEIISIIFIVFIIFVLIGFGHSTFVRNYTWKTEESLWIDAIDKYPNLIRPHNNLALHYYNTRQIAESMKEYKLALELEEEPHGNQKSYIHYNLGNVYLLFNQDDKAEEHYKKAIIIAPGPVGSIYNNLAQVMLKKGERQQALHYLLKGLTYESDLWKLHHNLGIWLLKGHDFKEAIIEFQKASNLSPDALISIEYLGIAHKRIGDLGKSIIYLKKVIEKSPKSPKAYLHLADSYISAGHEDLAKIIISEAIQKTPVVISNIQPLFPQDSPLDLINKDKIFSFFSNFYQKKIDELRN